MKTTQMRYTVEVYFEHKLVLPNLCMIFEFIQLFFDGHATQLNLFP